MLDQRPNVRSPDVPLCHDLLALPALPLPFLPVHLVVVAVIITHPQSLAPKDIPPQALDELRVGKIRHHRPLGPQRGGDQRGQPRPGAELEHVPAPDQGRVRLEVRGHHPAAVPEVVRLQRGVAYQVEGYGSRAVELEEVGCDRLVGLRRGWRGGGVVILRVGEEGELGF